MSTPRMLFVNHPVRSISATRSFFEGLGFSYNEQFSDETTGCLVISDLACIMQLEHARWADFVSDPIADTLGANGPAVREALLSINLESREDVDRLVDAAAAAGGRDLERPMDHGFMYQRAFQDLDGHTWEIFWMNPAVPDSGQSPEEWAAANL